MVSRKLNKKDYIFILAIILVAANLRAPLTSVGVLVPEINNSLHISTFQISLFTILPLLSFAFSSYISVNLSKKIGLKRTILIALIMIIIGIILRSSNTVFGLFIGMLFIGIGIAFGNVLTPVFIKESFPLHIGIITGIYTVAMNVFGALSSAISAPISEFTNYQFSLASIIFITIITLFLWMYVMKISNKTIIPSEEYRNDFSINIWKSKLAWQISLFMGAQSIMFYSLVNWLPLMLKQEGINISITGNYLTLMQIAIIIFTFLVPIIVVKQQNQMLLGFINGLLYIFGILGIIFIDHKYILIFILMLGIGAGISFGLVNTFFSIKVKKSDTAKKLSGMAQSIGYLLAAFSVMLFGLLHDITNDWNLSLYLLLMDAVMMLAVGILAGRRRTID